MKNFHVKFTAKKLTGNAGLVHLGKFAEKLQLPKTLKKIISIKRGPTADYEIANVIIMLMMGVLAFVAHISHLSILRHDERSSTKFQSFANCLTGINFPITERLDGYLSYLTNRHAMNYMKLKRSLGKKFGQKNGLVVLRLISIQV